jgi:hypothetical protein
MHACFLCKDRADLEGSSVGGYGGDRVSIAM